MTNSLSAFPPASGPASPTRLTARTPEDLLAAGAVVLGFWPTESVVMLTFGAQHSFHARVDLPSDEGALLELARTLVEPAVHHDVGRVVLLVHAADLDHGRAAWVALRAVFRRRGVEVAEALLVGPDRWWSLTQGGRPGGTAYDAAALAHHPFLAQAVVEGRVLHRSRAELAASLDADPAAVARVAALLEEQPHRDVATLEPSAVQLAEGTWVHALVARHLDVGGRPSDADAARLLCGLQSLRVRDAAWAAVTRPRARPAVGFFADLVRRTPDPLLAAPAALLGWAAWQSGDGALAWCALDRCDRVDPAYGLSALLAEALEKAVPPSVWPDGFDWKEGIGAG
jgi:hypothetical protein